MSIVPESIPLFAIHAGSTSFLLALLLVITKQWHGRVTMDSSVGVQKSHLAPTPRVGGIAILFGVLVGYHGFEAKGESLLLPLIVAGIPAFAFGLLEDLTKQVGVRTRLLATMACGVLGWAMTGESITSIDVPGVDWALGFTVVSVAFTAFAVAGVANAINIIDGFNGLAAGTVIIILSAFGIIATSLGDTDLALTCLILAGAVTGFALVNWPFGKLFLGDGGAYFVGFALAWLSVLLAARHSDVSPWAPVLVCGYPILEVLFSILRRQRRQQSPGAADRLHLHSLIKRRLVRKILPQSSRLVRNSMTGAVMWSVALLPAAIAVRWFDDTVPLVLGFAVCAGLYAVGYARLTQFRWCCPASPTLLLAVTKHFTYNNSKISSPVFATPEPLFGRCPRLRIAVVSNTAWYLFNFRLNLMHELQSKGHSVVAVAPQDPHALKIRKNGIEFKSVDITGGGTNVLTEFRSVIAIWQLLRREQVDLVLSYTPKGTLYSALACIARGIPFIPNVSGLGRAFIRNSPVTLVARVLYQLTFQRAEHVFFQNKEDMAVFVKHGIVRSDKAERLPGSGVDLARFVIKDAVYRAKDAPVFLLVARMLWDKGVGEFVEAARRVRAIHPEARFQLLGFLDVGNPSAIPRGQMEDWVAEGVVEYLGATDDVRKFLINADFVVLPSKYREGVPRTLLEAAATGRPVITTDAPGCRDTVIDYETGLLCQPADAHDLAAKMLHMISLSPEQHREMGKKGRRHIEEKFDEKVVLQRYVRMVQNVASLKQQTQASQVQEQV